MYLPLFDCDELIKMLFEAMEFTLTKKKQIRLFADDTSLCVIVESDVIWLAISNDLQNCLHKG